MPHVGFQSAKVTKMAHFWITMTGPSTDLQNILLRAVFVGSFCDNFNSSH